MGSGIKCSRCGSCLDLVYFGNKRFFHCWLCDEWYDGILPDLHTVPEEDVRVYANQIMKEIPKK